MAKSGRFGRILLCLAACGAAGLGSGLSRGEETPKPAAKPVPAPHVAQEGAAARLKQLVEAAEKAAEAEDWDRAGEKAEEAEVLMADWSTEVLRRGDISDLIARLRVVQRQMEQAEEEDEAAEGGEEASGGIVTEEVVALSPAELKAERDQVMAAERGAIFDFPIDLNDKVLTWVSIFTGRIKTKIENSLSAGSSYLPMIRQVFAEEGIPQDLAYLPLIESGYANKVKSYASAVGMWQFMPSTGRLFGLARNAWVDERRDPVKATRAAARYLRQLYQDSGDWYLALAGYNNGPGRVESGAQSIGSRNFWDLARSRYMRNQTKDYVPELCAAILVGRFPERYGLKIAQQKPYVFETVEVDRMTSLAVLARHAGTDLDELRGLNPELLRATTPPGRYTLRVPPGTSQATARALAQIPSGERLGGKPYLIRKGDTLARVAARFKVDPDDLLAANGLTRAQFRSGRRIQVPQPVTAAETVRAGAKAPVVAPKVEPPAEPLPSLPRTAPEPHPAAIETEVVKDVSPLPVQEPAGTVPQPAAKVQEREVPAKEAPEASRPARRAEARPRAHAVKRGETLYSIASRYGLDVKELRRWNRLRGNRIMAGQRLVLQKP